jgi:hypothetical protein
VFISTLQTTAAWLGGYHPISRPLVSTSVLRWLNGPVSYTSVRLRIFLGGGLRVVRQTRWIQLVFRRRTDRRRIVDCPALGRVRELAFDWLPGSCRLRRNNRCRSVGLHSLERRFQRAEFLLRPRGLREFSLGGCRRGPETLPVAALAALAAQRLSTGTATEIYIYTIDVAADQGVETILTREFYPSVRNTGCS